MRGCVGACVRDSANRQAHSRAGARARTGSRAGRGRSECGHACVRFEPRADGRPGSLGCDRPAVSARRHARRAGARGLCWTRRVRPGGPSAAGGRRRPSAREDPGRRRLRARRDSPGRRRGYRHRLDNGGRRRRRLDGRFRVSHAGDGDRCLADGGRRHCRRLHGRRFWSRNGGGRRSRNRLGNRIRDRRRGRAIRQQTEGIDVAVRIRLDAHTQMDVRLAVLCNAARPDGAEGLTLGHRDAVGDADRPQMDERDGVPAGGLDRDGLSSCGHGSGEAHGSPCWSDDLCTRVTSDVDSAVLPARVGTATRVRERLQHRTLHRPGPREPGGGKCEHNSHEPEDPPDHRLTSPLSTAATEHPHSSEAAGLLSILATRDVSRSAAGGRAAGLSATARLGRAGCGRSRSDPRQARLRVCAALRGSPARTRQRWPRPHRPTGAPAPPRRRA